MRPLARTQILLLEEDVTVADALAEEVESWLGARVFSVRSAPEAARLMASRPCHLLLTDWHAPGLAQLRPHSPMPVIVITDCDSSGLEGRRVLRGQFEILGVISRHQPISTILEQIEMIYFNLRPAFSA